MLLLSFAKLLFIAVKQWKSLSDYIRLKAFQRLEKSNNLKVLWTSQRPNIRDRSTDPHAKPVCVGGTCETHISHGLPEECNNNFLDDVQEWREVMRSFFLDDDSFNSRPIWKR